MNAPLKTSPASMAPPSIALAIMAARLALSRTYPGRNETLGWMSMAPHHFEPTPRRVCCGKAGLEFYRILDRISAGEAP